MFRKKCDQNKDSQGENSKYSANCIKAEHDDAEPHENSSGAKWRFLDGPKRGKK